MYCTPLPKDAQFCGVLAMNGTCGGGGGGRSSGGGSGNIAGADFGGAYRPLAAPLSAHERYAAALAHRRAAAAAAAHTGAAAL